MEATPYQKSVRHYVQVCVLPALHERGKESEKRHAFTLLRFLTNTPYLAFPAPLFQS